MVLVMIKINEKFDTLFRALASRDITHIYGPPASGKTNIALISTAHVATEKKVVYIDTEGGFSTQRLEQITKEQMNDVFKNIILLEPTTFDEQKVAIKKLDDMISDKVGLIILDSIASLYRIEGDKNTMELGRQLAKLLRIARKYNIPILITNQVYTDIDTGKIMPIGGDVTKYWAKIVIEFGRAGDFWFATLRKHKFLPEGVRLEFKIINDGIEAIKTSTPVGIVGTYAHNTGVNPYARA